MDGTENIKTNDDTFSDSSLNIAMIEDEQRTRMLLFFDEIESGKLVSKVGSVCKAESGSKYRKITTFQKGPGFEIAPLLF